MDKGGDSHDASALCLVEERQQKACDGKKREKQRRIGEWQRGKSQESERGGGGKETWRGRQERREREKNGIERGVIERVTGKKVSTGEQEGSHAVRRDGILKAVHERWYAHAKASIVQQNIQSSEVLHKLSHKVLSNKYIQSRIRSLSLSLSLTPEPTPPTLPPPPSPPLPFNYFSFLSS